jgi:hypothetical protein
VEVSKFLRFLVVVFGIATGAASTASSQEISISGYKAAGLPCAQDVFIPVAPSGSSNLSQYLSCSAFLTLNSLESTPPGSPTRLLGLDANNSLVTGPGGGGGGNVTAGTLVAGSVVLGGGPQSIVTVPDILFSTGVLSLGVNASESGAVKMYGSLSGNLTIKPAANAGASATLTIPLLAGSTDTVAVLGTPQVFTASQTFGEVHGASDVVTLSSNNYAAVIGDCGHTKLLPAGTSPTITLPNINPAAGVGCVITFVTTAATSYQAVAAGSGTTQNSLNFSHSRGANAGDHINAILVTPSSTAAKWDLSGDLTS